MPGHMQQRGPSTWRLHAFAGKDSNGRKQYTSKDVPRIEEGSGHRSGRVRHRSGQGEDRIVAGGGDHGVADAQQVAELEEGSALPRHNRPISRRDQARRTSPRLHARLSTATTPHRGPLRRVSNRRAVGVVHPEDPLGASPIAGLGPPAWIRLDHRHRRHRAPSARSREKWSRHPPTMYAPSSNTCSLPILTGALSSQSSPGPGCRRGEVAGLRWEDVDFKQGNLLIRRSVAAVPGGSQVKGTKTGDIRRIAIGPKTAKLLKAHRKRSDVRAKRCDARIEPSSYIFSPDPAGQRPYNPYTITRTFVAACAEAGVPRMRLHDLRHHSATTLLKSGASVGEVMDRHGWRTVEMVNRYRHLLEAQDSAAARALENA